MNAEMSRITVRNDYCTANRKKKEEEKITFWLMKIKNTFFMKWVS